MENNQQRKQESLPKSIEEIGTDNRISKKIGINTILTRELSSSLEDTSSSETAVL
jgi:hypothetical protein